MEIRPVESSDRTWIRGLLTQHFASARVVSRGVLHQADELPGFVAHEAGERAGLLLHHLAGESCEVVAIATVRPGRGAATALLGHVQRFAAARGCRRLWLVTTNDNDHASAFYERSGFRRVAIHWGAVDTARGLKPEIPLVNCRGVPIRDEIEYEIRLDSP